MRRRRWREIRPVTARSASVVSSMAAAEVSATAASPPMSNARPLHPAKRPGALPIPITTAALRRSAAACHDGGCDAPHSSATMITGTLLANAPAQAQTGLSDLHARVRADRLLRLPLCLDPAMQGIRFGTRGAMRRQPLLRRQADGAAAA